MMIFDDHDVHDDWNISWAWRRDFQAKSWWRDRIGGAYMSYWIYQHLGNLSPEDLAKDEQWQQVQELGDAAPMLSEFALRADAGPDGIQWTFRRTFGKVRVVVIDSRGGRVLGEDGKRQMVDDTEWQWVTESVSGDWDHVVLATSVPLLLSGGLHGLEAWNEAVCGGAWGKRFARTGEKIRRAADLEHWAAFGESFARFEKLLTGLATGAHGQPPASVTVISGDVHHSYLAQVDFPAGTRCAQRCLPGGLLTDPQRAAGEVPAAAAAGHLPLGSGDRHRAGLDGRGAQAPDPVAGYRRPVVPQHADRAGIRRAGRAHPF